MSTECRSGRRIIMNRFFLTAAIAIGVCIGTSAQSPKAKAAQNSTKPAQPTAARSTQPMDTEYTDSIIKNTTDKMFLTELVDHLPASDKVPSPAKVLGYPIGTPGKLTYTADMYRYFQALAKASPRVRIFTAPEKS